MKDFKKLKSFSSRTNLVALVEIDEKQYILKIYGDKQKAQDECKILERLKHTGYCPQNIDSGERHLLNEYIEGEDLKSVYMDALYNGDAKQIELLANRLCIFMQMFHFISGGLIMGDMDFADFILNDDRIYAVDFEECREGIPYEDIAGAIAYAVCYSIADLDLSSIFVEKVLNDFHIKMIDIVNYMRENMQAYCEKYRTNVNIDNLLDILLKKFD